MYKRFCLIALASVALPLAAQLVTAPPADRLELALTLCNDGAKDVVVTPGAEVFDWVNLAANDPMVPEDPAWKLGAKKLALAGKSVTIPAHGTAETVIATAVGGALKLW